MWADVTGSGEDAPAACGTPPAWLGADRFGRLTPLGELAEWSIALAC